MKKLLILLILFVATGTAYSWSGANQVKPGTVITTTVVAIKLAEAKAALSKANVKTSKYNLGTADGGI